MNLTFEGDSRASGAGHPPDNPVMRRLLMRFTVRRLILGVSLLTFSLSYVGSYYHLSRRGIREAAEYGTNQFLYVPMKEFVAKETPSKQQIFTTLYFPLNWLDQKLFGAPEPIRCFIWRLTG